MTSPLHAPSLTASPSTSTPDGGLVLPRKLGWGIVIGAVSVIFAAGAWAASLDRRVAELEGKADVATVDRKETSKRLERIERVMCVVCLHQVDAKSCPASCGL